jgi:hypothetical protein
MKKNTFRVYYVDVNDKKMMGVVERFNRTIRGLINKYLTTYKTTKYIDVLNKIVHTYNTTYHSTIKSSPIDADVGVIQGVLQDKELKAMKEEQVFDIGDSVRFIKNRVMFEKGSLPKWSKEVHKTIDKKVHSYKLDNGKFYKYYQLQGVKGVETFEPQKQPRAGVTRETLRQDNRVRRTLKSDDMDVGMVIHEDRVRNRPNRYASYKYK